MKHLVRPSFILLLLLFLLKYAQAQDLSQTIRGTIIDQDSRIPLIGANVLILDSDPLQADISDQEGQFRLAEVPVGRVSLKISYIGYEDKIIPNLLVSSGKEVVLNIELTESVKVLNEIVVTAKENKTEVLNDMSLISARTFSVEETSRYAGAIDDPARMVSAFAGVNINAEGDNDIFVRGNSSKGILWRLEGVEIPNPNHFADEGSTGGPINALNSAMLGNSDFFTGAFAPEYGNASSAVFDMKLRNGNNEKREYSATASVLGLDLTAEGPFKKEYGGSYLANYRYSTLSLLDQSGIVDFSGVPKYQDASFKIRLPLNHDHQIALFGLGGISKIVQEETDEENEARILWRGNFGAKLGVLGLSHTYLINEKTHLKSTIAATGSSSDAYYETINKSDELFNEFNEDLSKSAYIFSSTLNVKLNARNKVRTGFILTRLHFDMTSNAWNYENDQMERILNQKGDANTLQGFVSWKHRFNKNLAMVSGVHYLHFLLNDNYSVEPRLGFQWKSSEKQSFNMGLGLHSKLESISVYMAEQLLEDGTYFKPNRDLGISKAAHFVLGYDYLINQNTHFKVEVYYQHLYDVPVEDKMDSALSWLNATGWFTTRTLVNEGTGTNYGLEFTLERYFHQGVYYMSTVSLYKSKYKALDGVSRNSAFDGNYVANFLGGKEFRIGKARKNKTLFINAKAALIGGRRYTPIDLEASRELGEAMIDESNPYSAKGDDILKIDLAIGIRRNKRKTTTELKFDVQNVSNNKAVVNEYYDNTTEKLIVSKQLPVFPVISWKISF